ncbi:MAG TPA: tRNA (adenosine(37)-N6)-dimethylallyltransferase MiaA [Geminicoccaceae bacterium]|nr:tRNA (adenosine(37)-N6)-dimethylallyltransferase MiaA [Geminicoccaceae bacterium]
MTGLVVIGGPSASGKSALALRLAEAQAGVIINADSMQLYRELPVLTARPGPADEARVPHRLYGILDAADPASAGRWLALAGAAIGESAAAGRLPIVVGGTGLYLKALLHGLAPVPEVPAAVRRETQETFARLGGPAFHAELARRDPVMAARLRPSDRQRLLRAFEVVAATGRSLAEWQAEPAFRVPLPDPVQGFALLPPRTELHRRIERRLQAMIDAGALAELAALRAARPDPALPLLRAVAVPELLAHLEGRLDLAGALAGALARTRQYAKRQITWLRHQLPELQPLHAFGDELAALPDAGGLEPLLLTDAALQHSFRPTQEQGPKPANRGQDQSR